VNGIANDRGQVAWQSNARAIAEQCLSRLNIILEDTLVQFFFINKLSDPLLKLADVLLGPFNL